MLSKLLMLENFVITIHPNSPKQKSYQALPNISKSLKSLSESPCQRQKSCQALPNISKSLKSLSESPCQRQKSCQALPNISKSLKSLSESPCQRQKSCQALPNIYKSLKSLRKVLAKEALTYKQSYPKIYKDKKKRGYI
jgi:hypothetical protein